MDEELEAEKFLEPTASVHIDNTASRCSIAISLKRIADVLERLYPSPAPNIAEEIPETATDLPLNWRRNRGLD